MKQKKLGLLLVSSFLVCSTLVGCGNKKEDKPSIEPESPTSESEEDSTPVVNEYTIKFVNDDGTELETKTVKEGVVPEYTGATPTKAATAQYSYAFDKWVPDIVAASQDATYTASYTSSVNSYVVTFDSNGGSAVASQTIEYGGKVSKPADPTRAREGNSFYEFVEWQLNEAPYDFNAEVVANITLVAKWNTINYSEPVITIEGDVTEFNVNAGDDLLLPLVSAVDYLGNKLPIEYEDSFGDSKIKNSVFTSKVAGAHEITFYAEDELEGYSTRTITVNVIPATAETEVSAEENDPENITKYSTYKENFARGSKSPFYKSLVDGANASYVSGTDEAIAGNSLIFNAKNIIGSANALFGKVINDVVLRETQVTYTISFDYKALETTGCYDGLYFSPSYDTAGGAMGKDTKLAPVVGTTVHFEETYSRFVFPAQPTNCYLRFFNHNASNTEVDSLIAIDNIVVKAKEETQITYVSPTTEQLAAEAGFTWDFTEAAGTFSNSTFIGINEVENAEAKAAMEANANFKDNVIRVSGAGSHTFNGLNGNNVITGKVLEVVAVYYAVKDIGNVIYMNANGGNTTISGDNIVRTVIDGNIKQIKTTLLLDSYGGQEIFNFYGNAGDDIYVGKLTARLYDYVPPQEVVDKPTPYIPTTAEIAAGFTWDQKDKFIDFDNSQYIDVANMENADAKAAIQGSDLFKDHVLRFKGGKMLLGVGKNNLTAGHIFKVEMYYYSVSDAFQFLIVYGDGNSNFTQPDSAYTREVVNGNIKKFTFQVELSAAMLQLDTLLTTFNGTVEMYIGKVTVSCVEPEITFTDKVPTTEELASGFTWEIGSADKHIGFQSCNEVTKVSSIEDSTIKTALTDKGTYVNHVKVSGGANAIFNGLSASNVPNGKALTIEMEYYEVGAVQHFLVNGSGVTVNKTSLGDKFVKISYSLSPTSSFQYFSIYNNADVYIYSIKATVADIELPDDETLAGHKVGEVITMYSSGGSFLEGPSKAGYTVSDYDNGIENLASMEGMGSAPKKISIVNASDIIIMSQGNQSKIEAGVKYTIRAYVYNVDWNGALFFANGRSEFWNVNSVPSAGYRVLSCTFTAGADCNYFSLYTNSNNMSGTFYLGNVTVTVDALAA